MQEKDLKTTTRQRIIIIIIAAALFLSTMTIYILIVLNGSQKSSDKQLDAQIAELQTQLTKQKAELEKEEKALSGKYLDTLLKYKKSQVKAYNSAKVTAAGLKTKDLQEGEGEKLDTKNSYYAYYVGWCADGSVFDSSFDNANTPSKLKSPFEASYKSNVFAGWKEGVLGMKIGGMREIAMPGELGGGNAQEICGGKNKPLKFIVLAIKPEEKFIKLSQNYHIISYKLQMLYNQKTKQNSGAGAAIQ